MVVEAVPWGVPWDHSETGIPLSSEARAAGSPSQAHLCACGCPWAALLGGGCSAGVVVAAAGGSRETVTPRCFVNCFSQLVCSGLGLSGTVWKCDSLFNVAAH